AGEGNRTPRSERDVLDLRRLDVERDAVERLVGRGPEREHRERAPRVERNVRVAWEVPAHDAYAVRVQRLDEAGEARRIHDVRGRVVVRRFDPDRRDTASRDAPPRCPGGCGD